MRTRLAVLLFLGVSALAVTTFMIVKRSGVEDTNRFPIYFSDSNDARDYNKRDLQIPGDENKTLLAEVLHRILAGQSQFTDEQKSIRILRYVTSVLADKPNQGSATKILQDGFALCAGKSHVFVMLCRTAGIPGRYVGAMYVPDLGSHALAEAFYDNRWHLYDATYGLFFYSHPEYDSGGYVTSFHDLVTDPFGWTAFKVVPVPGKRHSDDALANFPVTRLADPATGPRREFRLIDEYRKELSEAFPIAYGDDDMVSYPIDADLSNTEALWYGQVNESSGDLETFSPRFSGSHYVGNSTPPGFHTWVIRTEPNTSVNIEYYSTRDNPPELHLIALRAARLVERRSEGREVVFRIHVDDGEAIISVYCPGACFNVDAMHIFR
jgi:Transglutaminase-like superfamily